MPALLTKHLSTNHRNLKNADGTISCASVADGDQEEGEEMAEEEEEGIEEEA